MNSQQKDEQLTKSMLHVSEKMASKCRFKVGGPDKLSGHEGCCYVKGQTESD